ncbi:MAG: UTP--glucose-1-phosphate uridylyltransferase [Sandaracinaceae bacterium]
MTGELTELGIDDATASLLHQYGFDPPTFHRLRERLRAEGADPASNRLAARVEPPPADAVRTLPAPGSAEHSEMVARGEEAIAEGRVGTLVLAGGMATRFGGVVKATVEAVDGRTFLELKVAGARRAAERASARVPVFVMTSFATDAEVRRAAERLSSDAAPVTCFPQTISLRLTPDAELFRTPAGELSPYAPGHGDTPSAFAASGLLARFQDGGGRHLAMSNVDNLGATLDPAVIGAHLAGGASLTAEVVAKEPGDKGGAPARVDGRVEIVEAFRFPEGFDQDTIGVFNTNTFVLDASALAREYELTWFAVRKTVEGQPASQFERLGGQLTAFVESRFLEVPRQGPTGRFQPVKDPAELDRRRPDIRSLLTTRGIL